MDDRSNALRETHLGAKRKRKTGPSVGEPLQAAYQKVMARKGKPAGLPKPG